MRIIAAVVFLFSPLAQANQEYWSKMMSHYKPMHPKTVQRQCKNCHSGPSFLNPFGTDVGKNVWVDDQIDFSKMDARDSDGDGIPNREEIVDKGTPPGSAQN
jgi:hypothetical protein